MFQTIATRREVAAMMEDKLGFWIQKGWFASAFGIGEAPQIKNVGVTWNQYGIPTITAVNLEGNPIGIPPQVSNFSLYGSF